MPFRTLPHRAPEGARAGLEYGPSLPEPLVVASLDRQLEREGRTTAVLVHGFAYEHEDSGAQVAVPEGYITDFASIPAAARFAFPPYGRHAKAAVLHDFLYSVGEDGHRAFADVIFRDAMTDLGVEGARRDIMYQAVHLFGSGGYGRADAEWKESWADWREGVRKPAPYAREAFYQGSWPKPPRAGYEPD